MPETIDKVHIWYGANGSETNEKLFDPVPGCSSFKRGDLLRQDEDGVFAAAPIGCAVPHGRLVFGIALTDLTTDRPVPAALADPNLRIVLPFNGSTATDLVGKDVGLIRERPGAWVADLRGDHAPVTTITAIHPQYAIGEHYGWVELKFIQANKGETA